MPVPAIAPNTAPPVAAEIATADPSPMLDTHATAQPIPHVPVHTTAHSPAPYVVAPLFSSIIFTLYYEIL